MIIFYTFANFHPLTNSQFLKRAAKYYFFQTKLRKKVNPLIVKMEVGVTLLKRWTAAVSCKKMKKVRFVYYR